MGRRTGFTRQDQTACSIGRGDSWVRVMTGAAQRSLQHMLPAGKPPLYFQHEGHSRTIIGIERFRPAEQGKNKSKPGLKEGCSDDGFQYHLLLLDPSFKTNNIASALSSGQGWQVWPLSDTTHSSYLLCWGDRPTVATLLCCMTSLVFSLHALQHVAMVFGKMHLHRLFVRDMQTALWLRHLFA